MSLMDDIRSWDELRLALVGLRKSRNLTQGELAKATGVSRQRINAIESNPAANLETQTLFRLLAALGASIAIQPEGRPTLPQIIKMRGHDSSGYGAITPLRDGEK